jgi:hypothetical protein
MCHTPPLILAFYHWVGSTAMPWLHVAIDLLSAWFLAQCVQLHTTTQTRELEEEREIYDSAHVPVHSQEGRKLVVHLPERIHPHLPAITAAMYPPLFLSTQTRINMTRLLLFFYCYSCC